MTVNYQFLKSYKKNCPWKNSFLYDRIGSSFVAHQLLPNTMVLNFFVKYLGLAMFYVTSDHFCVRSTDVHKRFACVLGKPTSGICAEETERLVRTELIP